MRAEAFYTDQPPDRIISSECEYNIQNTIDGNTYPVSQYINDTALKGSKLRRSLDFLSNGAKLYVDCDNIEYSAPESRGPRAALVADTAGKFVVAELVERSKVPHRGLYRTAGTYLYRQDTEKGSNENSSGYHENYLIPRSLTEVLMANDVMTTFLATRVWSTSGMVRDGKYVYSQKMWGIGGALVRGWGDRTIHGKKPMAAIPAIEQDKDTLGDQQWARLEVRCADASQSPVSRFLSFGATSLVLRMIEHRQLFDDRLTDISLVRPVEDALTIAGDLTNEQRYEAANGDKLTVLDVQEAFIELAYELSDKVDLPEDEVTALLLWDDINTLLRNHRIFPEELGTVLPKRLEIAARFAYLYKKSCEEGCDFTSARIAKLNLGWDCILPEGGSMQWWGKIGSDLMTTAEVEKLMYSPPTDTRAAIRARYIANHSNEINGICWPKIRLGSKTVSLTDPYNSS